MFTGSLTRLWGVCRSYAPWGVKTHNVVLWGSKHGRQFGSPQDLAKAEVSRALVRAYASFAKMVRRQQIALSHIGVSAQEALGNLRSINDHLNKRRPPSTSAKRESEA